MKKLVLAFLLIFTQIVIAQDVFEGAIIAKLDDKEHNTKYELSIFTNKKGEIVISLQGTYKVNQQTQTVKMKQIMKPDKVFIIYNKDGREVYSEIPAGDINKLLGPFEIKSTKEYPSILGYKTKEIIMNTNDKEVIYIVAEDIKFPLYLYTDVFQDYIYAGLARNKIEEFPLKVIVKDKETGKELLRFEVIEIQPKELPQNLFTLPDGIEKVPLY